MSYIYLASPYTHEDAAVRERRYHAALHAVKYLLQQKRWVYSPIVHCHHLATLHGAPFTFDAWEAYDFAMIEKADELLILRIDGYETSRGVAAERAEAERLGIKWSFL